MRALAIAAVVLVVIIGAVVVGVRLIQGPEVVQGESDLRFREIAIPRSHEGDLKNDLPFMGMAAVDVDGDGVDEIFFSGGAGQADGLFRFDGDAFTEMSTGESFAKDPDEATFGAASIDANGDGLEELFVVRESGVYYYVNDGESRFTGSRVEFGMASNTTPLSVALGDINRDGWVDLYISGYVRAEEIEGETNFDADYGGYSYLLLNQGDNVWADVSEDAGVFRKHNTFVAVFADLDNDEWVDLVVAQDTGFLEIWSNQQDGTFRREPDPTVYCYPMGIGVGDINNDGLVDIYASNVGTTLPEALLRGNLPKDAPFNMDYILLRNEGDFHFADISIEANAAKYGFGWGVVIADFNNDSRMDLYCAQNYARFPGAKYLEAYPGRLLQQDDAGTFHAVEGVAGLTNGGFGLTHVVSDFNGDGALDIVMGNLTGPARAFLNEGGDRHWIGVQLPSTASWLNTRVTVTTAAGEVITRQSFAGEGLCSDQSDAVYVGLGASAGPVHVKIQPPGGEAVEYSEMAVDQTLKISR